uniref:Uncharacterized protein n=1 Tax=uncultured bacterium pBE3-1 TaxID=1781161 RepID=A0A1C9U539_9BACT|nr:hypothetical protein [uncultured bacterium pBE3-1]
MSGGQSKRCTAARIKSETHDNKQLKQLVFNDLAQPPQHFISKSMSSGSVDSVDNSAPGPNLL